MIVNAIGVYMVGLGFSSLVLGWIGATVDEPNPIILLGLCLLWPITVCYTIGGLLAGDSA